MTNKRQKINRQITKVFDELTDEYMHENDTVSNHDDGNVTASASSSKINPDNEYYLINDFLNTPCSCGKHCKKNLSFDEAARSRKEFDSLSRDEKNTFILSQLHLFMHHSSQSCSARQVKTRIRQKFDYHISIDRPVCKDVFLFYYGETIARLKRLQKHLLEMGISSSTHGNIGRQPSHTCSFEEKTAIQMFIINYAETHGMPDPFSSLRHGKGRLRILLPSILNYASVHQAYELSLQNQNKPSVGYRTFMRCWQEFCSHIVFSKPRTDLCMTCEDFKKEINKITSDLDEKRDDDKEKIYKKALKHIEDAKKERTYYAACSKLAEEHYLRLGLKNIPSRSIKPNSRNMMQHYSWDFAQQLLYPYEDQQVGHIYFKTPRKAQLFGICCEGIPRQTNYLIDETDFPDKDANTVISILDHFFAYHGLGEKYACLTADNCVGQNKNNAVLHYLLYRVLAGLHDNIELSFMIVGHTKFAPDGYFGLIRKHYRRSSIYTYQDLVQTIINSSAHGHNTCQPVGNYGTPTNSQPLIYRDWSSWLLKFFKKLPDITSYRHFKIEKSKPGVVSIKRAIDGEETEIALVKRTIPFGKNKSFRRPSKITPKGLSLTRQWYLYEQIRMHIPNEPDKEMTCPKPKKTKPKD
ncbi:conserved hypothetical protein [Beggiatoa sp. PS]|nr:conserved hypothetical protein [Beggiatoa sp. PS]